MKVVIWYKHSVDTGFFQEVFEDLSPAQAQAIEKRFSDGFLNGEYVALRIEMEAI